jgi:hypothetical protein
MTIEEQIQQNISSQTEPKRSEMQELHRQILQILPNVKLWFDDGKNSEHKTVSNPTIGYGLYTIHYANGKTRDFFQIGMSANTTGISVYILGIEGKNALANLCADTIGKASVSGYCIKFKTLQDINIDVLKAAIAYGVEMSNV